MNTIAVRDYFLPDVDKSEVMRYLGAKAVNYETEILIDECIKEFGTGTKYKVCYLESDVRTGGNEVIFKDFSFSSCDLSKNLKNSRKAIIFAATLGINIDRYIMKYSKISPTKSVVFDALGTERIEALCDTFNREIAEKYEKVGVFCKPRFSAGYGDFPLEIQEKIINMLDCQRKIGLTLNNSYLMSPSKSVTAVIGLE